MTEVSQDAEWDANADAIAQAEQDLNALDNGIVQMEVVEEGEEENGDNTSEVPDSGVCQDTAGQEPEAPVAD